MTSISQAEVAARSAASPALQFIVRWRLHIAACATTGAWAWSSLLGAPASLPDLVIVASVVWSIYLFNRLTDQREDAVNCPDELANAIAKARTIRLVTFALLVIAFWSAAAQAAELRAAAGVAALQKPALVALLLLLGWSYGAAPRLKSRFFIKNLSSSTGWSVLTVVLPVLHRDVTLAALLLALGSMFGAVFVVELLWDIRDREGDRIAGIRSIPVVLGLAATRRWIMIVNAVPALLVAIGLITNELRTPWLLVLFNSVLIMICLAALADFDGERRRWSHALVITQTGLLVCLGVLANLVT
jgi:4-hydroxybenzoate polyprenyltransferase